MLTQNHMIQYIACTHPPTMQNELNALSQYNDTTYFPNVVHYKDTVISRKVQQFFQDSIKEALKDLENYIIDFFVAPDKVDRSCC